MTRVCSYLRDRREVLVAGLILAAMAAVPLPVWGQWTGTSPVWTNSNVGIGVQTPGQKLEVADQNAIKLGAAYISSGLPSANHAAFASNALFNGSYWTIPNAAATSQMLQFYSGEIFFLQTLTPGGTDWQYRFTIGTNGNVGIGVMSPQYKLAVNGNIGAQDIIVTNTGWSDYVFRPGYRLRPLSEVSQFIQAHGHLPDIPTEAEVKEKGVSLGDMQAKLLAKVEELTLHMIQQDQENREVRETLTRENRELRDRLARLEKGATPSSTPAVDK